MALLATLAGGCAGDGAESVQPERVDVADTASPVANGDVMAPAAGAPPHTIVIETTTSTEPLWAPTTTAPMAVLQPAAAGVCSGDVSGDPSQPPTGLAEAQAAIAPALGDPRFRGSNLSVSIWVDGWGELAAVNTNRTYPAASNQKLMTAAGAFERLDVNERIKTNVIATGPTVDGIVRGDVVLVGGGDPTVTRSGLRSLDALAAQLKAKGIVQIEGKVLVDESRYDTERSVPSWPAGWQSIVGGPLSALVVDRNKNVDPIDPALSNGDLFLASLGTVGIRVDGEVEHGTVPDVGGQLVGVLEGPTYGEIVVDMLQKSDNFAAELLVKEIGRRHSGVGSTTAGLASIRDAVAVLCVPPGGGDVDGSGLSADTSHSSDQFRRLLQLAARRSWGARFKGSLPVAGQSGTLAGRLIGPFTTGNVRAKTGSIASGKALSGYVTTAGGRQAYFSILVNGNATGGLEPAIDNIAAQIAALQN